MVVVGDRPDVLLYGTCVLLVNVKRESAECKPGWSESASDP